MNMKEAFRYQKFLNSLMDQAGSVIVMARNCLVTTKKHLRSGAIQDGKDFEECTEPYYQFCNDDILSFMKMLIDEKEKLTHAINEAKGLSDFDFDAVMESNKLRRIFCKYTEQMLLHKPSLADIEEGQAYTFNAEGNQVPYYYDIEVTSEDSYDRADAKRLMKDILVLADKASEEADYFLVSTKVNYEPPFNINDTFNDIMEVHTLLS